MLSFVNKASKKLRNKKDDDSDVSRSSSLSRSFSFRSRNKDKDKEKDDKDKKRLSGLRYSNKSKDSVNLIASSKKSLDVKRDKKANEPVVPAPAEPVGAGAGAGAGPGAVGVTEEAEKPDAVADAALPTDTADTTADTAAVPDAADAADTLAPKEPEILSDISPNTSITPTSKVPPIPVADETQPLLGTSSIQESDPTSSYMPWSYLGSPIMSIGLIILVIILIIVFVLYHDFDVDIQKAVQPRLNSINLLGINTKGVQVQVNCSVVLSYDDISWGFLQLYKAIGMMFLTVILSPQIPINVILNNLDSLNVTTPPLQVNLPNHSLSEFAFESTVGVSDTSLIKLLNDLLNNEETDVRLTTLFKADISTWLLTLHDHQIHVDQNFTLKNNLSSLMEISGTSIDYTDELMIFNGSCKYPNVYFKEFLPDFNKYNLLLKCNDEFVVVGDMILTPQETLFDINGIVDGLNNTSVSEECMNQLVRDLANSEPTQLYVRSNNNSSYPQWLNNIVNNVHVQVPRIPASSTPVNIPVTLIEEMQLTIKGNSLEGAIAVPFKVPGELYAVLNIHANGMSIHSETVLDNNTLHEGFMVYDMDPEFIQRFWSNQIIDMEADIEIEELQVKSPLFHEVNLNNVTSAINVVLRNGLDITSFNTSVDVEEVWAKEIDEKHLQVLAFCRVVIDQVEILIDDLVMFDLIYNETRIGQVSTDSIIPGKATRIDVIVAKDETHKLNQFVSKFISNDPESIGIEFYEPQLLLQLKLPNISVPEISFGEEKSFILGSTVHLFSSDIEVEIYNPISNQDIIVDLYNVVAKYQGTKIGEVTKPQTIRLKPGINKTDRIPFKIDAVGGDILRKALNGELKVSVEGVFNLRIVEFELEVQYEGQGLRASIQL